MNDWKRLLILLVVYLIVIACIYSTPQNFYHAEKEQIALTAIKQSSQSTPIISLVLTNTPNSYPSKLFSWFVGDWQLVDSGEIVHFGEDHQFRLTGQDGIYGEYRFFNETEILFSWGSEEIRVEVWQVDQNTMFINTPDGLSHKLIRVNDNL